MANVNPSFSIAKALIRSFILYSCLKKPKSGYALLAQGKNILLTNWSAGSFYPHLSFLLDQKLLLRKKTGSNRITYEYSTTRLGIEYLNHISSYFKNSVLKEFFGALILGDFNERITKS